MPGLTITPPRVCRALRTDGERCTKTAWKGSDFCGSHQPEPQVAASGAARTLARAQAAADRQAIADAPVPFENVRLCKGVSRRGARAGRSCRAPALKDSDFCRSHQDGEGDMHRVNAEIIRTRTEERQHLLKAIKAEIAKNPKRVFTVLFEGLEARRQVFDQSTKQWVESDLPDWPTRLKCFQELADRIYGKSTHRVEHSGAAGGPITIAAIVGDAEDFRAVLEQGKVSDWYEQIDDAEEVAAEDGHLLESIPAEDLGS